MNRGWFGVGQHRGQALGVPGQGRREQRHGDVAGVHGREERRDVVDALGCEDRHPVAGRGDLLEPGRNGVDLSPEAVPAEFDDLAVRILRVVDEPVRRTLAHRRAIAFQERRQRDAVRYDDPAVRLNVLVQRFRCSNNAVTQGFPTHMSTLVAGLTNRRVQ
jgi:hypothetical protein